LRFPLYAKLARLPEYQRLGFRRWVADAIEGGELPDVLAVEHLLQHREHPAPSSEVKAMRLLAWMVTERRAQAGIGVYAKEFDFTAKGVDADHEACHLAEARQPAELIPLIGILRNKGYVEYPSKLRIPTQAGRVFRREAGRGSDVKPATVPRFIRPPVRG